MQDYWAALAVTGDHNGKTMRRDARPPWQRWDPKQPSKLALCDNMTAMEAGKPRAAFCRFADNF
jgi:hypothetical protein